MLFGLFKSKKNNYNQKKITSKSHKEFGYLILMFLLILVIPTKGSDESILPMLVENPSKAMPYFIITLFIFPVYYLVCWIIDKIFKKT